MIIITFNRHRSSIWYIRKTLREKCRNMEFFVVRIFLYSVRMQENTDQKKLLIWTLFTHHNFPKNKYFLTLDTRTFLCVSVDKKCQFFRKFLGKLEIEASILRYSKSRSKSQMSKLKYKLFLTLSVKQNLLKFKLSSTNFNYYLTLAIVISNTKIEPVEAGETRQSLLKSMKKEQFFLINATSNRMEKNNFLKESTQNISRPVISGNLCDKIKRNDILHQNKNDSANKTINIHRSEPLHYSHLQENSGWEDLKENSTSLNINGTSFIDKSILAWLNSPSFQYVFYSNNITAKNDFLKQFGVPFTLENHAFNKQLYKNGSKTYNTNYKELLRKNHLMFNISSQGSINNNPYRIEEKGNSMMFVKATTLNEFNNSTNTLTNKRSRLPKLEMMIESENAASPIYDAQFETVERGFSGGEIHETDSKDVTRNDQQVAPSKISQERDYGKFITDQEGKKNEHDLKNCIYVLKVNKTLKNNAKHQPFLSEDEKEIKGNKMIMENKEYKDYDNQGAILNQTEQKVKVVPEPVINNSFARNFNVNKWKKNKLLQHNFIRNTKDDGGKIDNTTEMEARSTIPKANFLSSTSVAERSYLEDTNSMLKKEKKIEEVHNLKSQAKNIGSFIHIIITPSHTSSKENFEIRRPISHNLKKRNLVDHPYLQISNKGAQKKNQVQQTLQNNHRKSHGANDRNTNHFLQHIQYNHSKRWLYNRIPNNSTRKSLATTDVKKTQNKQFSSLNIGKNYKNNHNTFFHFLGTGMKRTTIPDYQHYYNIAKHHENIDTKRNSSYIATPEMFSNNSNISDKDINNDIITQRDQENLTMMDLLLTQMSELEKNAENARNSFQLPNSQLGNNSNLFLDDFLNDGLKDNTLLDSDLSIGVTSQFPKPNQMSTHNPTIFSKILPNKELPTNQYVPFAIDRTNKSVNSKFLTPNLSIEKIADVSLLKTGEDLSAIKKSSESAILGDSNLKSTNETFTNKPFNSNNPSKTIGNVTLDVSKPNLIEAFKEVSSQVEVNPGSSDGKSTQTDSLLITDELQKLEIVEGMSQQNAL